MSCSYMGDGYVVKFNMLMYVDRLMELVDVQLVVL